MTTPPPARYDIAALEAQVHALFRLHADANGNGADGAPITVEIDIYTAQNLIECAQSLHWLHTNGKLGACEGEPACSSLGVCTYCQIEYELTGLVF